MSQLSNVQKCKRWHFFLALNSEFVHDNNAFLTVMGGKHGISGYIYQTIVSVIESLKQDDWKYIDIEPDTPNEKTDIIWEKENGDKHCHQIKSSINNFAPADINRWLEDLIKDNNDAAWYELTLIGTVSSKTKQLINDINSNKINSELTAGLQLNFDKISITNLPNDVGILESRIRDEMSRFLSAEGYHLPHSSIALISGGLVFQFFQFSILDSRVSRQAVVDCILTWVTSNYQRELKASGAKSSLKVSFYDTKNKIVSDKWQLKHLELSHHLTDKHLNNVKHIYASLNNLGFITVNTLQPNVFSEMQQQLENVLGPYEKVEIPADIQKSIKKNVKKYLDDEVSDAFFNLGDLRRRRSFINPMAGPTWDYSGEADARSRHKLIMELHRELSILDELDMIYLLFTKTTYLSLVLSNHAAYDETVSVKLSFPKAIKIVNANTITLGNAEAIEELLNSNILDDLKPESDSFAEEYVSDINMIEIPVMDTQRTLSFQKRRLSNRMQSIFDFQEFNYLPDKTILRFDFGKINPNEHLLFPSFLFVVASTSFMIDYEIKSKLSTIISKGSIECVVSR